MKPLNMPRSIKIGAMVYTVKDITTRDENFIGRCYPNQGRIEIDKQIQGNRRIQTLFHEIIHALAGEFSIKLNERQTDTVSTGLITVLRDNPKLIKLLKEME